MKRLDIKGINDLCMKKIEELDKQSKNPNDFRTPVLYRRHDGVDSEIAAFLYIGNGITRHFNFHPLRKDFQETHVTPREISDGECYRVLKATLESVKTLLDGIVVNTTPSQFDVIEVES